MVVNVQKLIELQTAALRQCTAGPASELSRAPQIPRTFDLVMSEVPVTFGCGLYLVTAPSAGGKSVVARGIAYEAAHAEERLRSVGMVHIFEPGAPPYSKAGGEALFRHPDQFLQLGDTGDLVAWMTDSSLMSDEEKAPALLVIDSINDAMRAFDGTNRKNQGAAEQGMQPADRLFTSTLNNLAERNNICILGCASKDLVPFIEKLEGACQGMITAMGPSTFRKIDRVSGRSDRNYTVSNAALTAALSVMGYPLDRSSTRSTGLPGDVDAN